METFKSLNDYIAILDDVHTLSRLRGWFDMAYEQCVKIGAPRSEARAHIETAMACRRRLSELDIPMFIEVAERCER